MGICPSRLTPEQNQELGNSKLIDRQMREAAERESAKIKLLLLGTGESGKSTLFKQMRILYGNGFSSDDLVRYKWHIWANIIECMRSVCDAVEMFGYGKLITDPKVLEAFKMIKNIQRDSVLELNEEIRENILFLWNDPVVIRTIARRNEFQFITGLFSFIPRLDMIASPDYVPTVEDVLISRVRTTGITEESFVIKNREFLITDVGGQKNERRKWIHCFDKVTAIIFVVALSEFDESLFEESNVNRMMDSLNLFVSICRNPHLRGIPIMLFLNKCDLFREKIARVSLGNVPHWSDYCGAPHSYEEGVDYFLNKFLSSNKDKTRDIYYHVTCATDTSNIRFVLDACTEILLRDDLDKLGIISH